MVEAVSNDLRGRTDSVAADVQVVLEPPRVGADGAQHYINQGGMELVIFTPGGSWTEAGVRVGQIHVPQLPASLPGTASAFRMFAYPWDLPAMSCRWLLRAIRRAPKPRRTSGSSCSPRSSARATSRLTTRFWRSW